MIFFFVLDTCENRKCKPLVHGLVPYPVVPQLHAVLELLIADSEYGLSKYTNFLDNIVNRTCKYINISPCFVEMI